MAMVVLARLNRHARRPVSRSPIRRRSPRNDPQVPRDLADTVPASNRPDAASRSRSRRCCPAGVCRRRCAYRLPRSYPGNQPPSRPDRYEFNLVSRPKLASSPPPGASMLFYRAALPLSRKTLDFVAGIIRSHRAAIGSLWRKLDPARQALGRGGRRPGRSATAPPAPDRRSGRGDSGLAVPPDRRAGPA